MKESKKSELLNKFKNQGFIVLDNYFDKDYCDKARNKIDLMIKNHPEKSFCTKTEQTGGDIRFFKFENYSETAISFSKDKWLREIVSEYLGRDLKTHFVLAGKVSKSNWESNSGGGWHRDSDFTQLKAMLYLSNVSSKNGPFLFVENSKSIDTKRRKTTLKNSLIFYIKFFLRTFKLYPPRYDEIEIKEYIENNNLKINEITGKEGTVVLFDSSYIHRGKNIVEGTRYSFTNYYFGNTPTDHEKSNIIFGKYFK